MAEKYQPPFTITKGILALVSEISEQVGYLDAVGMMPISPRLRKGNLVKTITGTLAIEGNTLSLDQVSDIVDGKRVLGSAREISEVHGAIKAYENLSRFDMTSEDDLLAAHGLLMGEVLVRSGAFRRDSVGIKKGGEVIHVAPGAEMVPQLVRDLLNWLATSDDHPLIASSAFHYEFEFIHPFADGNGRMGRLWQTLILSRWKPVFACLPLESVIKEMQDGNYLALRQADGAGNSTEFIEFMLAAILQTCRDVGQTSDNVPINVPKHVPLKRRQQILTLIGADKEITIVRLAEQCKVSTKTIKRDIALLKDENRLVRVGSLKSGYWQVEK
jgi:Fic family protein